MFEQKKRTLFLSENEVEWMIAVLSRFYFIKPVRMVIRFLVSRINS